MTNCPARIKIPVYFPATVIRIGETRESKE